ncbi:ATP-binding protein [Exilibacterium tricleocarpae]|uniref:ATP-binding protein n=1 Tax=Exilibacterium tricleocarpae TaxID=2591008 RepID=A0A545U9K3_9GAMM|nr:ATP-binding protein [Exilibacterium tricleocarpae]TQV86093.1 ATP-binding protein [Exilibacterium tricleocarpae]
MELIHKLPCEACSTELCGVREQVRDICIQLGYPSTDTDCITLAIDEACANVIRHAYKDRTDGRFILEIYRDDGMVVFKLQDFADPVDRDCLQPPAENLREPGGLGLLLIHKVMDSVTLLPPPPNVGNLLEMRKKLPQ